MSTDNYEEFNAIKEFPDIKSGISEYALVSHDVKDTLVGLSYAANLLREDAASFVKDVLSKVVRGEKVPSPEALDIQVSFYEAASNAISDVISGILTDLGVDSILEVFDEDEVEASVEKLNSKLHDLDGPEVKGNPDPFADGDVEDHPLFGNYI